LSAQRNVRQESQGWNMFGKGNSDN
jgi:hypothetical protein